TTRSTCSGCSRPTACTATTEPCTRSPPTTRAMPKPGAQCRRPVPALLERRGAGAAERAPRNAADARGHDQPVCLAGRVPAARRLDPQRPFGETVEEVIGQQPLEHDHRARIAAD